MRERALPAQETNQPLERIKVLEDTAHPLLAADRTLWLEIARRTWRSRYERQGLLVEAEALEQAEQECLADEEVRARRREREAARRAELDQQYVQQFAERVRELYPHCPPGREVTIAEHACLKYSGRVGRSRDIYYSAGPAAMGQE